MNLPARRECISLLKEHETPEHIIAHSIVTEKVCMHLGRKLKAHGIKINLQLLSRAGLLHDIAKFKTLHKDLLHGTEGEKILNELGFNEIARITKNHLLSRILVKGALQNWEDKIVYYADKRVVHDRIVSLDERFDYLRKRYGTISKEAMRSINAAYLPVKELEKQIFNKAKCDISLKGLM
ncbi:MAG: HD domain-containing protein [Candidatus Diapherotrites archaeon]|nr:HD domain-containing protein [Candidatus Diapherotrites archaeon]